MATSLRKATFNLPTTLLAALDDAVSHGIAPTKNAFVVRALTRALDDARRRARDARWVEAARDPLFMRDLDEVDAAFAHADGETARQIV